MFLACLVAIGCYQANRFAYVLGIPPDHFASFFPSTPFLVAALLLVPRRIWPVLIAAGLGAMALADLKNGQPIGFVISFSFGNLVEALVATLGISRFKEVPDLGSLKALAKYFAVTVILAPFASAFLGATGSAPGGYWLVWKLWFFSDALGYLTVTPAILTWAHEGRAWARHSRNYLELTALMASLAFFGYVTFLRTEGRESQPALLYSLVPLLLWAALRLGLKGVSTSTLVVAFLATWGAAHDVGPFAGGGPLNNAQSLQLFLFFATIPFMILAVIAEEQNRAKQTLIDEGKQLIEAQRLAQMGSWQRDPNTDTIIWSEELYRIAGRDPNLPPPSYEELAQLFTRESWEQLQRASEESLRTGKAFQLDLEMVRPDGTRRWLIGRGEAQRDTEGRIVSLHGTTQDITERKVAEEALQKGEERFRMAAQAGRMFAYEWDTATDVITRWGEYLQMLGVDEGVPMTRQQLLSKVHPDDRESLVAAMAQFSPESPYVQIRYRLVRSDGEMIWLERNSRAYFDEQGKMVRLLGMVVDITERKLAEEALIGMSRKLISAQEEERIRIARELHDDFVQRLSLLSVDLQGIKEGLPDSAVELRSRMDEVEKRTSEISTDVQSLSHELHSSKLEYVGLVAGMRSFCTELAQKKKVEIDFNHAGIPPVVSQETSLCLFRVMQEALHNALKHSGVHHFEVKLHGSPTEIHLTVRDEGVGFNPELARTSRGLGLISMRERVNMVNGSFSITSRPLSGTEVSVRVPLSAETRAEEAKVAGA
jgi:signal transduction histidine kinase/integral membrane sensor domain MASE1